MRQRLSRQQGLVPEQKLTETPVTVIGVGAIGRQVALQLVSLGVTQLQLIDFDDVDETNISTQGYRNRDIGRLKVEALCDDLHAIDPKLQVELIRDRYRPKYETHHAVFCCVDSISTRTVIWKALQDRCRFWCDGRMLGEVMRVLAVSSPADQTHYPQTLFSQSEAQTGSCTARGVIYTAHIAAGLMLHQYVRWLRGQPVEPDQTLNLMAAELSLDAECSP
ncbi:putative adenylyltransferase/sulfurtransferase MoeZ [Calycomorphotria hydatis]|uniref:Putative adenylyltransferase/sulfurtransferase MoeZ n=1 Tax=Calycomorphotria hydatis TaxID=2528027 RepID=A0A517T8P4_9PLAN|nr:putative adenylyltransferase/sulfurtransferase MoeZ [Calycomorphotria hydatis]